MKKMWEPFETFHLLLFNFMKEGLSFVSGLLLAIFIFTIAHFLAFSAKHITLSVVHHSKSLQMTFAGNPVDPATRFLFLP